MAEYGYAECHLRQVSFILTAANNLFMLSVVMLNVIKLNVFMLSVMKPRQGISNEILFRIIDQ
jgi:hypothetical protein